MGIVRGLMIAAGVGLAAVGLLLLTAGPTTIVPALWMLGSGIVLIVAALLERSRYRSSHAEVSSEPPGPGGGEPTDRPMEPRFRRTDERFIDPTTGTSMRVWVDSASGERRYRAED